MHVIRSEFVLTLKRKHPSLVSPAGSSQCDSKDNWIIGVLICAFAYLWACLQRGSARPTVGEGSIVAFCLLFFNLLLCLLKRTCLLSCIPFSVSAVSMCHFSVTKTQKWCDATHQRHNRETSTPLWLLIVLHHGCFHYEQPSQWGTSLHKDRTNTQ